VRRRLLRANASPSMVVACIAVILAMTGSAFAASALITGADVKDGSLTRADLSGRTIRSLKGRRGPRGRNGQDGFVGPEGPQGSTGERGPIGPQGIQGPAGPKGATGDTGRQGPQGIQGRTGDTGQQGPPGNDGAPGTPGQSLIGNAFVGSTALGTPLASPGGPTTTSDGADLSTGASWPNPLSPGQYLVHVQISVTDADAADGRVEYGVARLFLDSTPLDGTTSDPDGGSADGDTLLVTAALPDDARTPAQASGTFLINVGDNDASGGETLSLRAAVQTDDTNSANATARVIVTRIG
jgi:hypothetical protein